MSQGINFAYGLQPIQSLIGNGTANKLQAYKIYAPSDTGVTDAAQTFSFGDAVAFAPSAAANVGYIAPLFNNVVGASLQTRVGNATDPILGVFNGCSFTDINGVEQVQSYFTGGTAVLPGSSIYALINDDPMAVYKVQVSNSTGVNNTTIFLNNMVGGNANLNYGGVAFTDANIKKAAAYGGKNSGCYLDLSTVKTAAAGGVAALDLKIIGIARSPFNTTVLPTTNQTVVAGVDMPFIDVYVKINRHAYSGNTNVAT